MMLTRLELISAMVLQGLLATGRTEVVPVYDSKGKRVGDETLEQAAVRHAKLLMIELAKEIQE